MNFRRISTVTILEIGAALFGSLLLAGLAVLFGSRCAGQIERMRNHKVPPPPPGEVPPIRHTGISNVAAR